MTSRPAKPIPPRNDAPGERRERRSPPMRAPRSRPTWEPIPLHVPIPEPADRRPRPRTEESTPRGVVIISYGDES